MKIGNIWNNYAAVGGYETLMNWCFQGRKQFQEYALAHCLSFCPPGEKHTHANPGEAQFLPQESGALGFVIFARHISSMR